MADTGQKHTKKNAAVILSYAMPRHFSPVQTPLENPVASIHAGFTAVHSNAQLYTKAMHMHRLWSQTAAPNMPGREPFLCFLSTAHEVGP
jgi:hypothetical protein